MNKSDIVYLHLQKIIIDHSIDSQITKKRVCEILAWLGIPKQFRLKAIEIMREKKLVKRINRDNIKIINSNKSKHIDKKLNELIWENFF